MPNNKHANTATFLLKFMSKHKLYGVNHLINDQELKKSRPSYAASSQLSITPVPLIKPRNISVNKTGVSYKQSALDDKKKAFIHDLYKELTTDISTITNAADQLVNEKRLLFIRELLINLGSEKAK